VSAGPANGPGTGGPARARAEAPTHPAVTRPAFARRIAMRRGPSDPERFSAGTEEPLELEDVLALAAIIATADVSMFEYDPEERLLRVREGVPEYMLAAVASVKHKMTKREWTKGGETTHEVEIRLWDKPRTVEAYGRRFDAFPTKLELTTPEDARRELERLGLPVPGAEAEGA
jgi:hypothetical protein